MKRYISLALSAALCLAMFPTQAKAQECTASDNNHTRTPASAKLVDSDKIELSNGWALSYSIYTDSETGAVWGDGFVEDPESIDATGVAGRWLSYSHYNGEFDFLGADDGKQLRVSFGPSDVTWSWTPEDGWIPDIAHPDAGPQPLWTAIIVVAAALVLLSGDSGCSCGHNGGAENHPGTNHPE